ncbi:MAG: DUF3108 domain-containing protein [Akkermansiaceae bacterium]
MLRFLCAIILFSSGADSAPEWKQALSKSGVGSHPMIEPSRLDYSLSWKGMLKAGALTIEFAPQNIKKSGSFVIKSSASSKGPAASLFPYSHSYWSEIHPKSLKSKYFHAIESDSKEKVTTTNRYDQSSVKIEESSTDTKSGATTVEKINFLQGPARDVFSAILYVRSQKLDVGDEYRLLVLPFKSPYLLNIKVEAKEKHMSTDAIRISFSLKKIDRDTLEFVQYKKLKKPVRLWLSDDSERVPLELRAAVYIGDVRAVLTKHTQFK